MTSKSNSACKNPPRGDFQRSGNVKFASNMKKIFFLFFFISGLNFRSWAQFLAILDVRVVFCMSNCVFWQLDMSVGPKFGQKHTKIQKLGPNFGRRYVWATDRRETQLYIVICNLIFRPRAQFLGIFDVRIGFYVSNCVFSQLGTSIGRKFGQQIIKHKFV